MAGSIDVLTALGEGFARGTATRKRENELIQLERTEREVERRERRKSEILSALQRFAPLVDFETLKRASQMVPKAMQSERGEEAIYGALQPRTEPTVREQVDLANLKLRGAELQTKLNPPVTKLDQARTAEIQARTAGQKALTDYRKKQTQLLDSYANAKTDANKKSVLTALERSYASQIKSIEKQLGEYGYAMDEADIIQLNTEKEAIKNDLESVRSELQGMGGVESKKKESELSNEQLLKALEALSK